MNKFLLAALLFLAPAVAHASTCPISAGASTASIQSTLTSCGSGNTATFAAGSYSITSQINLPCGVSIQGPAQDTTKWPITPTAILTNSGMVNTAGFRTTACSTAAAIQFIQWNGANPSSGGGFIYVTPGTNNLTIQYNWLYGVSAQQTASNIADTLIWMDGSDVAGSTHTQNTTIRWNRLGTPNSSDCANLMNVVGGPTDAANYASHLVCTQSGSLTFNVTGVGNKPAGYNAGSGAICLYQDGDVEKSAGGYCGGVGVHVMTDNLTISNNSFAHLEQGIKYFEGCGSNVCPDQFYVNNMVANANDFTQTHRITVEAQQTMRTAPFQMTNNSTHDEILFGGVSWALSLPQSSITSDPQVPTISSNNLLIDNSAHGTDKNGFGAARSYGVEFWGYGAQSKNNLIQGVWGGSYAWGFGGSNAGGAFWNISNNTMQQATTFFEGYITNEEGASNPPTQTANVTSHTIAAVTSVAPTILPTSGSVSFPLTVTLSDPGYTSSSSLPQGNTGIWYTIDGSTPVPGSGTAQRLDSGGTFSLASAATVKAVGMWGALNQPTSYPSGYGFVPSSPVTATYTGGGAPTLTGGFLGTSPINGVNTMTVGGSTLQMVATGNYSDGSTGAFPSPVWTSNNTPVCTIGSSSGLVTAVSGGFCSINAQSGSIHSSSWGITVGTVGLTSGLLCKTGSASGGLPGPGGTNPTQGIACHP